MIKEESFRRERKDWRYSKIIRVCTRGEDKPRPVIG
jgi:hypothetical protein